MIRSLTRYPDTLLFMRYHPIFFTPSYVICNVRSTFHCLSYDFFFLVSNRILCNVFFCDIQKKEKKEKKEKN
ncbi:hypothetical protein C1645_790538 [Glomus cerebriforme]|uniref:Uncharacterized protein n=1 Tax=Glomus cerebriforme TaxID=658196 RepID=A0A397SF47_9GLOM|nr:hypothetical protein C1645_790538 [Glomus cerebriforme]